MNLKVDYSRKYTKDQASQIKSVLSSPDKWCKGPFALDADGESCGYDSEDAVKFCIGATLLKLRLPLVPLNILAVKRGYPSIIFLNDDPKTTFESTMELINEATEE